MSRNETEEAVLVVSFFSSALGYINETHLAQFRLLIDRT
jgi:hypothetical protein